jgi:hypothetical protein
VSRFDREAAPALREARRAVRARALAALATTLLDQARASRGRLALRPMEKDALLLEVRDVATLVRQGGLYAIERRDFAVALVCPEEWPFARAASLAAWVLAPDDFAHPNSDGRGFCLDLAGILPEQVAPLLYDNLRLARFRLDHCVDRAAAAWVRGALADLPADRRPLLAEGTSAASEHAASRAFELDPATHASAAPTFAEPTDRAALLAVDVVSGTLATAVPPTAWPAVLRLARAVGDPVDRARSAFLAAAAAELRAGRPCWCGGPALRAESDSWQLASELHALARGVAVLGEPALAASFLEIIASRERTRPNGPAR